MKYGKNARVSRDTLTIPFKHEGAAVAEETG